MVDELCDSTKIIYVYKKKRWITKDLYLIANIIVIFPIERKDSFSTLSTLFFLVFFCHKALAIV